MFGPTGKEMLAFAIFLMVVGWAVIQGLLWLLSFVHIEVPS